MKKIVLIISILCIYANGFSQVTLSIEEYEKLKTVKTEQEIKINSLNKRIDSLEKNVIKSLRDNISDMKETHNKELSKLQEKLKKDSVRLHKQINKLETDKAGLQNDINKNKQKMENIKSLETRLKQKTDSITKLQATINQKDEQITAERQKTNEEKQNGERQAIAAKANGRQEILNQIVQSMDKPFDDLIRSSTRQSVERDLPLVANDSATYKKLQDLLKYFAAEQTLAERCESRKVQSDLEQIAGIEQSELVKNLIDKLENYEIYSDGLKNTIDTIRLVIDKKWNAVSASAEEAKQRLISFELMQYMYGYSKFTYPYLSKIVLGIIKDKYINADKKIDEWLNKLEE